MTIIWKKLHNISSTFICKLMSYRKPNMYVPLTPVLTEASCTMDSDSRPSTDCIDASRVSCCTPADTSSFVIELDGTSQYVTVQYGAVLYCAANFT